MKLDLDVDINVNNMQEIKDLKQEIRDFARDVRLAANPLASLGRVKAQLSAAAARDGNAALDLEKQSYAELKKKFAFKGRMQAQQAREEAAAAKRVRDEQAETRRTLNDNLNFSMRMLRQRERAEADAERATRREIEATAKARDRAHRKALSDARDLERTHAKAAERAGRGAGQVRSGVGRVAGTAAATGVAGGYALERAISKGIGARADTDDVETQLRIFNDVPDEKNPGQHRKMTAEDITKLRRGPAGLDALAIGTGNTVADTLRAYNESAKAGLIDPMGQTRNILKAGSALELDPMKTTKLAGTLARNLGSAATPDRMYSVLNAIGVGAREDPTQSNEIVEGLNRAQGVLSMSKGFTPEDLVAMVSGGQSVGIDPGKAGTAVTALGTALLKGGGKFTDPMDRKKNNWAAKKLGFGSGKDLANKFAGENGKAVYYQVLQGLKGMAPQLRQQVASALSGNQWADEDLAIVNGLDGQIKTDKEIHDPRNANFINEASAEKMKSWRMLWAQSQTIFSLFWESFGRGFDDVLREINSFFLDLNGKLNYDSITASVREALDGLRQGLGFDTWKQALESLVPSNIGNLGKKIGQFARGFSSAIREIAGAVSSVAGLFGGGGGAESIGKLTAQFISLGIACVALAPVVGVLGGLASIVLGVANMARAAAGVLGMGAGAAAGGLGGGAVAGALAGVARLLSGGFILGLAAEIGNLRGPISTMILDAVRPLVSAIWSGLKSAFTLDGLKAGGSALLDELIPAPLKRWLDSGIPDPSKADSGAKADGSHWVDPPTRDTSPEKLRQAIQDNTEALRKKLKEDGAKGSPTDSSGRQEITYDQWQAQFAGLKGAALGRALEAQKDRSGGPSWGPRTGERINQGLRGHIGRLRGGGGVPGAGGRAVSGPGNGTMPTSSTAGSLTDLINQEAARAGIDPRIMQGIRAGESGHRGDYDVKSDSKEDSYGPYQLNRRGGLGAVFEKETGLDARDPRTIPAQTRWVAELIKKRGRGVLRQWYGYKGDRDADPAWGNSGYTPNSPAGSGGGSASGPVARGKGGESVPYLSGQIDVEGQKFDYGSGNGNGKNSIPFGTYPVTPDQIGPWGRANGALGINGNQIWDKTLGRMREGIEFHAASNARMLTAGCIGVAKEQYATFKDRLLSVYRRSGKAFLTVGPNGASISADDPSTRVAADTKRTRDLGAGLSKPKLGELDLTPQAELGSKASLGQNTPLRQAPVGSGGGSQGGGNTTTNHVNINGFNKSPKELANEVQRSIQDDMNRRVHDFDGFA